MNEFSEEMRGLEISDVTFHAAGEEDVGRGLIGWISCRVNRALALEGLTLRRTAAGRCAIAFPARTDRAGRRHFFIRPLSDAVRRDLEHQILEHLGAGKESR